MKFKFILNIRPDNLTSKKIRDFYILESCDLYDFDHLRLDYIYSDFDHCINRFWLEEAGPFRVSSSLQVVRIKYRMPTAVIIYT